MLSLGIDWWLVAMTWYSTPSLVADDKKVGCVRSGNLARRGRNSEHARQPEGVCSTECIRTEGHSMD